MKADFAETAAAIGHSASNGAQREKIILSYLDRYLPRNVKAIGSGEVISVDGIRSRQCDILIVDPATPPLYEGADGEGHRLVPAECVFGVIEVKSTLTSSGVKSACENIKSVKQLKKSAFLPDLFPRETVRYGKKWHHCPTFGIIFAFDGSPIKSLGESFSNWCSGVQLEHRPDSVWVMGSGFLSWTEEDHPWELSGYCSPRSMLKAIEPIEGQDVIYPLTLRLSGHANQTFSPPFNLHDYTQGDVLGINPIGNMWRQVDLDLRKPCDAVDDGN